MSDMQYRSLGHSGLHLSVVGLGSWLTFGNSVEQDATRECVRAAFDAGVTFFDTASTYSKGRAEEALGPILRELPRDRIVIGTKLFWPTGETPNERGLSRKHIRDEAYKSLKRLQVDYIDLYQCHRYDEATPIEETCEMMNDLVRAGTILYWGVSEWNADQIAGAVNLCRVRGWSVPISNQPQYSALWRRIETRVLPTCERYGLGNVVWSPLAMGILTGKYTDAANPPAGTRAAGPYREFMSEYFTQPVLDAVAQLRPLAEEAGVSLAQLALAWTLRQPAVTSAIVGATNPAHVRDNVRAGSAAIDGRVFAEMDRILQPVQAFEPYTS
jgi:aryl-alcohol dehydrogenase-like predicted oxidoreductase